MIKRFQDVQTTVEISYPYMILRWPRNKGMQIIRISRSPNEDPRVVSISAEDLEDFDQELRSMERETPGLDKADYLEKIFQLNTERVEMQSANTR